MAVFHYIQVISPVSQRHGVDIVVLVAKFGFDGYDAGIGGEQDCKTGRTSDLVVLSFCESLIFYGIDPMVWIRCVNQFSYEVEVRCFGENIFHILRSLGENACG